MCIKRIVGTLVIGMMTSVLLASAGEALGGVRVVGVRSWSAPDSTRVVLDLTGEVSFKEFLLRDPLRLVVDVKGAIPPREADKADVEIGDTLVKRVRMGLNRPSILRVVVELEKEVAYKVFFLKRIGDKLPRLVIHLKSPELERSHKERRRVIGQKERTHSWIVVIDPGHGGEDPGAIGPRGTKEKDVVLAIARELRKQLNRIKGIKAFLTRDGDYFIPLDKRREIARDYGADLLVSIHADASMNSRTTGASVYCLSIRGATDEAARILAEKENASDLIAGVNLDNGDQNLNTILLDLVQTYTINESLEWGGMVLSELERIQRIKFTFPRQAGFRVLKSPDIPSILIEVGFITNRKEERLLLSKAFQRRMATAIAKATLGYICHRMKTEKERFARPQCPKRIKTHLVRKGETLYHIASFYGIPLRRLLDVNGLREGSAIYPGQKLLIP